MNVLVRQKMKRALATVGVLVVVGLIVLANSDNQRDGKNDDKAGYGDDVEKIQETGPRESGSDQSPSPQDIASIGQLVSTTDDRLHDLALSYIDTDSSYIHPAANRLFTSPTGPKPHSIRQLVTTTSVVIDIEDPCGGTGGENQTMLVMIICAVADVAKRDAIRETYGKALKANNRTSVYFVVGTSEDINIQFQLAVESHLHGDILQFAFHDNYYNLTLKSIAMLRWTALNCPRVKFLFKLDSDCFIRTKHLLAQLDAFPADTIYGLFRPTGLVLNRPTDRQSKNAKWYIDPRYYPYAFYPPHTAGVYLIPGHLTARLYAAIVSEPTTETIPALPFEDVYITGVLAEKASIRRKHFGGIGLLHSGDKWKIDLLKRYTVHYEELAERDLYRLWKMFGEAY